MASPSDALVHLCYVKFDVRLELEILFVRALDLFFDRLFEIGHLEYVSHLSLLTLALTYLFLSGINSAFAAVHFSALRITLIS